MKRMLAVALLLAGATSLSGCYLSRQVAGDDLVGGPINPGLWATLPIDTILMPFEYAHFTKNNDSWNPWNAERVRHDYVDMFEFTTE